MAGKKALARGNAPTPYMPYGGQVESYRPRTPAETLDDSLSAVIETTGLNTVTHMAYDSVRTVAAHKARILADDPSVEAELTALAFNHVQCLLEIQRHVADNLKRDKS